MTIARNPRNGNLQIAVNVAHIVIAFVGLVATNIVLLVGGVYTLTELQMAPLRTRVMTLEHDLDAITTAAALTTEQLTVLRARVEGNRQALVEVESQFCAMSDYSNVIHANDLRIMAALWVKIMSTAFEIGNAFYRQCNRPPLPQ